MAGRERVSWRTGQGSHPAVSGGPGSSPGLLPVAASLLHPTAGSRDSSLCVCLPGCYLPFLSLSSGFIDTLSVLAGISV